MSIDAGDRWVEYEIKEREQVGRYMYEHQYDYVDRSRYERVEKQLTKAKEIIENMLYYVKQCTCERSNYAEIEEDIKEAEQFLREIHI